MALEADRRYAQEVEAVMTRAYGPLEIQDEDQAEEVKAAMEALLRSLHLADSRKGNAEQHAARLQAWQYMSRLLFGETTHE